jgi:uncharacterized membrane protein
MSDIANTNSSSSGKMVPIVSYLTIIGWIIAYVLHTNNRTNLGAFHLRQSAFLFIVGALTSFFGTIFGGNGFFGGLFNLAFGLIGIVLFIFFVMGIIRAANGEEKPLPIVGLAAQKWLSGLK